MKIRGKLIDGFGNFDSNRLTELLGNDYIPFTSDEITALSKIPFAIISREWFMDYEYSMGAEGTGKATEFYNPTTLENNHFLSFWGCFSTSPFENAVVFTPDSIGVTSVTVSPSTATVSAGQGVKLSATVVTTGFANKAVHWAVDSTSETGGVTITDDGYLMIPTGYTAASTVTVTATSIYDKTVSGTATITTA